MNGIIARYFKTVTLFSSARVVGPLRWYSQNSGKSNVEVTEQEIKEVLQKKFPLAQMITVEDVSGGCGAMFNIYVESSEFNGLSITKQHRTVYDTLKAQISNIHGLHLETKVVK